MPGHGLAVGDDEHRLEAYQGGQVYIGDAGLWLWELAKGVRCRNDVFRYLLKFINFGHPITWMARGQIQIREMSEVACGHPGVDKRGLLTGSCEVDHFQPVTGNVYEGRSECAVLLNVEKSSTCTFWFWFICSLSWKTDVEMSPWLQLPAQNGLGIAKPFSLD